MLMKKAFINSIWVQRFRVKMEENLPPGFRFHPTDEELIAFYLNRKVSDVCFTAKAIAVVDLNKCEPWDLPGKASMGEKDWYFFSLRDRKYPTGMRTNRATEAGYWKTTGKDKEIYSSGGGGMLVGMKKTLVFYKGRAPRGEKSNWVMHEYRLENKHHYKPPKEEWVICRVFQKSSTGKKPNQTLDSLESPCDTNSIGGGHAEMPSLIENSLTNSSSGYNNIDANMLYPASSSDVPSLPFLGWPSNPSTLLGSNFSMNSLLLKALQLRSYQQRENHWNISDNYSFFRQGFSPFGNEMSSDFQASSSKSIENLTPQQEQPLNLDSIW